MAADVLATPGARASADKVSLKWSSLGKIAYGLSSKEPQYMFWYFKLFPCLDSTQMIGIMQRRQEPDQVI